MEKWDSAEKKIQNISKIIKWWTNKIGGKKLVVGEGG